MSKSPKEHLIRFPDVDLCVFEWGKPGGQQVLLVHATGFMPAAGIRFCQAA